MNSRQYPRQIADALPAELPGLKAGLHFRLADEQGAVVNWKRPVDCGKIGRLNMAGVSIVVAPGGFTKPAVRLGESLGMRLLDGQRPVTSHARSLAPLDPLERLQDWLRGRSIVGLPSAAAGG